MLNILTLTWDNADRLSKLHNSLIPSLDGIDYQWFIKDNHSNDDTIQRASTWGDKVKVIAHPNNQQNFSQGCNLLFQEAAPQDNDYVMLLNNDVVFNDTNSIKKMLSIIQKDETVGMVGARLLYAETNKLQHSGVVFVPKWNTPMHFRAGQTTDNNAEQNRTFQAITGAVCITKAEYYRNIWTDPKTGIKGLDPNYFWAFDDSDACLSIKYNMGKQIVYCGETNISHEESASLKKNPTNKLFLNHNLKYLFGKWKGRYTIDLDDYTKNPKHNLYLGKQ
jgi:O-antigen biosynthesis protein